MSRPVDLNDLWLGNVELANFAAQLMTERGPDADDSVWADDPYGSGLTAALRDPAAVELVRREIERVSEDVGVDVSIGSVERTGTTLQAMGVELTVSPSGLEATE